MSEIENKTIFDDIAIRISLLKQKSLEKEIHSLLDEHSNERKLQAYLSTERIYSGPNMRKERDTFRSKAQSFRLNKHF